MKTCSICGYEIYWTEEASRWYHANLTDILTCPAVVVVPKADDLDRFTREQLMIMHATAARAAVTAYENATAILREQAELGYTPGDIELHGQLDLARRQVFAAGDEQYEHAKAISAELARREQARA